MTFRGYDDWTDALDSATDPLRRRRGETRADVALLDDGEPVELWPELVDAFLLVEMQRPWWAIA